MLHRLIIFFTLLLPYIIQAQSLDNFPLHIDIKTLGKVDGLSQSRVMCSVYDKHRGLIWIGTGGGINHYNGHKINSSPEQLQGTYSNALVESCSTDESGNIYFAMYDQGLLVLALDDTTIHYNNKNGLCCEGQTIRDVKVIGQNIWAGGSKGLNRINKDTNKTTQFFQNSLDIIEFNYFNGFLYIVEKNGFYRFNIVTLTLENLAKKSKLKPEFYSLHASKNGVILGTSHQGFYLYTEQGFNRIKGSSDNISLSAAIIDGYILYSANTEGLNILKVSDQTLQRFTTENSAINGNIYDVLDIPELNLISLSTRNGLSLINKDQLQFRTIKHQPLALKPIIPNNKIWAFSEHDTGLWIASSAGVSNYSFGTKTSKIYSRDLGNSIANDAWVIFEDFKKNTWIGTSQGLAKFNPEKNQFENVPIKENFSPDVISITSYKDKGLWIGTFGGGLYQYLFDGRIIEFPPIQENKRHIRSSGILSLLEFKEQLWIGGSVNGAAVFDYQTQEFTHFTSKSNGGPFTRSYVRQIFLDSQNKLWFANDAGLFYRTKKGNIVQDKTIGNALIYCLAEGDDNNLFIGTNKGLIIYKPSKKKFRLYKSDGLQSDEYNGRACKQLSSGAIALGGIEGFSIINTTTALEIGQRKFPELKITSIHSDLNTHKRNQNTIHIDEISEHLKLEFSTQNFYSEKNSLYSYRINQGKQHGIDSFPLEITFDFPPHGKTGVEVFRSIRGNSITSKIYEFNIYRDFFWFQTWYGESAIAMLIATFLAWLYKLRVDWLREQNRKLAVAVNLKTENLNQALDDKNYLLENISHEFKTPLSLILGRIQNIIDDKQDKEIEQELSYIESNAYRLHDLSEQLTRLSDIKHGYRHTETIDILYKSQFIVANMQSYVESQQSSIRYKALGFGASYFVHFQQGAWDTLLNNLITNAAKYSPDSATITLIIRKEDDRIVISVSNQLEDINTNINDLISRNVRGRSTKSGQGLGLDIVKQLVANHGGDIEFKQHQQSTHCVVQLPLNEQGNSSNFTRDPFCIETERPQQKILVVEDDHELLGFIKKSLEQDYQVIALANGKEASDYLKQDKLPNLILTDIDMPHMDGHELIQDIKLNEHLKHIPIFVLSGNSNPQERLHALSLSADQFISKPFDTKYLKFVIRNQLSTLANSQRQAKEFLIDEPSHSPTLDPFIRSVAEVIMQSYQDPSTQTSTIAGQLSLSEKTLNRKLQLLAGTSAVELLREYRLEQAQKMLANQDSIKSVCFSCGFKSSSYFSQTFKQRFGLSPSQYQRHKSTEEA